VGKARNGACGRIAVKQPLVGRPVEPFHQRGEQGAGFIVLLGRQQCDDLLFQRLQFGFDGFIARGSPAILPRLSYGRSFDRHAKTPCL